MKTLETVAMEGFHEDRVRSVLHQVELSVKHQSSSFGLGLITSVMSPWIRIHGGDSISMTKINEHVERFKENLKTAGYLQEKIKQHYLNNNHRLTLIMSPQAEYEEQLGAEERQKL
ncbi:presequence protease, mitochondrial-like [Halichondria panicea]|uniref:presequence protease, mitochondrial-like n=1 Tax=Halichondria panicea TaxID=6063 RepID=UPI00312B6200